MDGAVRTVGALLVLIVFVAKLILADQCALLVLVCNTTRNGKRA